MATPTQAIVGGPSRKDQSDTGAVMLLRLECLVQKCRVQVRTLRSPALVTRGVGWELMRRSLCRPLMVSHN